MSKKTYKYRLLRFLLFTLGGEVVFWILTWQVLQLFGVFSRESIGERMMFTEPNYIWLAFVSVPVLIAVFYFQMYLRNRRVNQFENEKVVESFLAPVSTKLIFIRYALIRNILVFGVFALMQPVLGTKTVEGQKRGVELMFVVDVSNSMNTRDIEGGETRLTAAKRAMNQTINQTSISRVGLLIFAGSAYPQMPLSSDMEMAKTYINELNTNLISNQGTNIASALNKTSGFYSKDRSKKVLFLITDGEDHEGGMEAAYAEIKKKNIETFVLGLGTEKGGVVLESEEPNAFPMRDETGNVVISRVNKSMLKEIASGLGGEVLLSNASFPNLSQFLTLINTSSETNTVNLEFKIRENRYQWPLGISLFLIVVLFLRESLPNKRIE